MASTVEMLRIMRHASKRLREECQNLIATGAGNRSQAAAFAYGAAVLDVVAAALDSDEESAEK